MGTIWDKILGFFGATPGTTNPATGVTTGAKSGYGGLFSALLGLGGGYLTYKEAKEAAEAAGEGGPAGTGYQGGIPEYAAYKQTVPTYDPNRRPGSSGKRYFTDTEFLETPAYNYIQPTFPEQAEGQTDEAYTQARTDLQTAARTTADAEQQAGLAALIEAAQTRGNTQNTALAARNIANPVKQSPYSNVGTAAAVTTPAAPPAPYAHEDIYAKLDKLIGGSQPAPYAPRPAYAKGGLMGMYLGGPTDGMADNVPARIEGGQEARLSDGEFVLPADVVSHLGNGNSDAGAKVLHGMMNKIRKARTGTTQQGKRIDPNNLIPR